MFIKSWKKREIANAIMKIRAYSIYFWKTTLPYDHKVQRDNTWRAAGPTLHVSTCHLTSPPALTTRSLSSGQLAT
jgi:hypothetical protein